MKIKTICILCFLLLADIACGQGLPPFVRQALDTNSATGVPSAGQIPIWGAGVWTFGAQTGGGGVPTTNLIVSLSSTNGFFIYTVTANGNTNAFFVVTNIPAGTLSKTIPLANFQAGFPTNNNGGALTNIPYGKIFTSTNGIFAPTVNVDGSTNWTFTLTNLAGISTGGGSAPSSYITNNTHFTKLSTAGVMDYEDMIWFDGSEIRGVLASPNGSFLMSSTVQLRNAGEGRYDMIIGGTPLMIVHPNSGFAFGGFDGTTLMWQSQGTLIIQTNLVLSGNGTAQSYSIKTNSITYPVPVVQAGHTNGLVGVTAFTVAFQNAMPNTNYSLSFSGSAALVSPLVSAKTTTTFTVNLTAFSGNFDWTAVQQTQ